MVNNEEDTVVTKIMLDALKPREVDLIELASALCSLKGVESVEVVVTEVDAKTETVKITINGKDLDIDDINEEMNTYSSVVRSIDAVTVTKK
ncbi:MAG: hypothetical protein B6U95_04990 [Thermofilum sp. ex4484_82]|nr:MAG: hypothetical protein B6U95_04990 [Thermofilum sp. ex4484_82]OYT38198.1 MAG: hypothetical protein B6U96_04985 [Archaeoglobales archaeon ex4484_92]